MEEYQKGTQRNPYTRAEYDELKNHNNWKGGWVSGLGAIMYISQDYKDYMYTLGTKTDPCPMEIYNEMLSNGTWEGGWVEHNGEIVYLPKLQIDLKPGTGSGCGSGSGSGSVGSGSGDESGSDSGSGSGDSSGARSPISSGEYVIGEVSIKTTTGKFEDLDRIGTLVVHWMAGNTSGSFGLAPISFDIRDKASGLKYDVHVGISSSWTAPYEASYMGGITLSSADETVSGNIEGIFVVPFMYRIHEDVNPSIE